MTIGEITLLVILIVLPTMTITKEISRRYASNKAYKEWLNFKYEENETVANGSFSFGAGNSNTIKG